LGLVSGAFVAQDNPRDPPSELAVKLAISVKEYDLAKPSQAES
jgi:hypothetical protein